MYIHEADKEGKVEKKKKGSSWYVPSMVSSRAEPKTRESFDIWISSFL